MKGVVALPFVMLSETEISLIRTMKLTITWYFKAMIEAHGFLIGQLGVDKVRPGYPP
jgi:hypothetical protein